jgi:hypothetical protein
MPKTLAFAFILGLSIVAVYGDKKDADCDFVDNTAPAALKGDQGTDKEEYFFTHFSDVDVGKDKLNYFAYILKNNHKTNLLDAEWSEADIEFRRIRTGGCGKNTFASGKEHEEKKSVIIYDGKKGKKKSNVPLYVQKEPKKKQNGKENGEAEKPNKPTLRSEIGLKAGAYHESESASTVDFRLLVESSVRDGLYTYVFSAKSKGTIFVNMAAFHKKLEGFKQAEVKYSTKPDELGRFVVEPGEKPLEITMVLKRGPEPQEKLETAAVSVGKSAKEPKPLAKARVSVYLPKSLEDD